MKGHYGQAKRELLDQLAAHGVTAATLTSILNVREHVVWRWMIGACSIPERYKMKMITLLHHLDLNKS